MRAVYWGIIFKYAPSTFNKNNNLTLWSQNSAGISTAAMLQHICNRTLINNNKLCGMELWPDGGSSVCVPVG